MLLMHVGSIYFGGIKIFWSGVIKTFCLQKFYNGNRSTHSAAHFSKRFISLLLLFSKEKQKEEI